MILGQISYLDCVIFLILLVPQLIIQVSILELLFCILKALPFLCMCGPTSASSLILLNIFRHAIAISVYL